MKTLFCAVLLFAAFAKADEDNDNWPCYMKKCGKTSKNLDECLVSHANLALDGVMKGDPTIGIPQYNDYNLGEVFFGQNNSYKVHMENIKIYGLKHLYVANFRWNFDQKTVDINFGYNSAIIISGDYQSWGSYKGIDSIGVGQIDLIFVGGSIGANLTYSMGYQLLPVLGRDYLQIKDTTCKHSSGFRVEYNNKLRPKAQAENNMAIINKNSDAGNHDPELTDIFCRLISEALNAVFFNFPLDLLFDS